MKGGAGVCRVMEKDEEAGRGGPFSILFYFFLCEGVMQVREVEAVRRMKVMRPMAGSVRDGDER